jgi:hypothetical protein
MLGASARYSCLHTPVETGTPPRQNDYISFKIISCREMIYHPFRHFDFFRKPSSFYINSQKRIEGEGKMLCNVDGRYAFGVFRIPSCGEAGGRWLTRTF